MGFNEMAYKQAKLDEENSHLTPKVIARIVRDYRWFSRNGETQDCVMECLDLMYPLGLGTIAGVIKKYAA